MLKSTFLISLVACHQVTVIVESLPENTPTNATIYITGQFNYWDTGDGRYLMKKNDHGEYVAKLPRGFGTLEYCFTRGNWESIEGDKCGKKIAHRKVELGYTDTIRHEVLSWLDLGSVNCGQFTIVLESIPKNTPKDAPIFLASSWNNWNPSDSNYLLQPHENGSFSISLAQKQQRIDFKFTRGSWETCEVDQHGNPIANHQYEFGKPDTLLLQVANWADLSAAHAN